MLRGDFQPKQVIIVEGEPDALTWMTERLKRPTAVLGVVSGSWNLRIAQRIPTGAIVYVRTHIDEAGDRYAAEITKSIGLRCFFERRCA